MVASETHICIFTRKACSAMKMDVESGARAWGQEEAVKFKKSRKKCEKSNLTQFSGLFYSV